MSAVGYRRLCVYVLILSMTTGLACDRQDRSAFVQGEPMTFELEGLRQLIERKSVVGESRILALGWAERDQHARLLWGAFDGTVLLDLDLPSIIRPSELAACIDGQNVDLLIGTETDEGSRAIGFSIRGDQLQGTVDSPEAVHTSTGSIQLRAIEGSGQCGLCVFDGASEVLSCTIGSEAALQRTWPTGPLGDWYVFDTGEQLYIADWSNDDEGWVTVRITPLEEGGPVESGWFHSYSVGQLPSLNDPGESYLAHPRFVPMADHLRVVFVDGTDWFTRLFVQRFPYSSPIPRDPELIESCRGTCKVYWVGRLEDATWIWFQDEMADWAERIDDSGDRSRIDFTVPPNVEALGGGLFKMGLGNDVANWWSLLIADSAEE